MKFAALFFFSIFFLDDSSTKEDRRRFLQFNRLIIIYFPEKKNGKKSTLNGITLMRRSGMDFCFLVVCCSMNENRNWNKEKNKQMLVGIQISGSFLSLVDRFNSPAFVVLWKKFHSFIQCTINDCCTLAQWWL